MIGLILRAMATAASKIDVLVVCNGCKYDTARIAVASRQPRVAPFGALASHLKQTMCRQLLLNRTLIWTAVLGARAHTTMSGGLSSSHWTDLRAPLASSGWANADAVACLFLIGILKYSEELTKGTGTASASSNSDLERFKFSASPEDTC